MNANPWPFDQAPNCATIVTSGVLDGRPVLFVSHDEDDHGWQFHDSLDAQPETARLVCLSHVLALDPALCALADLPPGWVAWRADATSAWQRELAPPDGDDGDEEEGESDD